MYKIHDFIQKVAKIFRKGSHFSENDIFFFFSFYYFHETWSILTACCVSLHRRPHRAKNEAIGHLQKRPYLKD